jgi:hypothetical protein
VFHQPVFKKKYRLVSTASHRKISVKNWIFDDPFHKKLIYFAYFNMRHPVKVSHSFVDFVVNYELSNFMNYSKNNTRFII